MTIHVFLLQVLITKLRSANTVETRQYRKASKALLVLIPLLGITYLVVLAGPNENGVGSYIFVCVRAFLLSTQVMPIKCNSSCVVFVAAKLFSLLQWFEISWASAFASLQTFVAISTLWHSFKFSLAFSLSFLLFALFSSSPSCSLLRDYVTLYGCKYNRHSVAQESQMD